MIAKRVEKRQAAPFKGLAAYVLAEKDGGRGDPVDWKLGQYVLDEPHDGEKVAWAHATNCEADDLGIAVKEIMATQARNKTVRTDKSYHLVVSFPPGERPTREQMEDIEREVCAVLGFGEHQRIAAVHQDRDHWHMHIAINRVHPGTLRALEPHRDYFLLQAACIELEIRHGLTRTPHSPSLEAAKGKAAEMEAHTGRVSFGRWVMENAAEHLVAAARTARTWDDLHRAAASYGLVIQPRGAGLIIANQAGPAHGRMKASAIDRCLSFQALTDSLGPYQPPSAEVSGQEPSMRYARAPRGADPGLWARYQQERASLAVDRKAALDQLRAGHLKYAQELHVWYRGRYAAAKAAHLNRGDRIATRRTLELEFAADWQKRKAMEAEQRNRVKAQHKVPSWEGFLARQGAQGDRAAMRLLERRVEALIRTADGVAERPADQAPGVGRV